jgi:hypothetical protein
MSTTFGIKIESIGSTIEVAHRSGIGKGEVLLTILNPLLYLVKSDTEVIPLDNSAQGIETVNDIFNCKNIINDF